MEMTVGANIKRLRTSKNITQEQLSVAMNVTCAAVSKWERGETYPDITLLQPLAYFFGVTLDELMGYNQEKRPAFLIFQGHFHHHHPFWLHNHRWQKTSTYLMYSLNRSSFHFLKV